MGRNPYIDVSLAVKFLAQSKTRSFETFLERQIKPDENSLSTACDKLLNEARLGQITIISKGSPIDRANLAEDGLFIDAEGNSICRFTPRPLEDLIVPSPENIREKTPWYLHEYLPSAIPWTRLKVLSSEVLDLKNVLPNKGGATKMELPSASEKEVRKYLIEISRKNGGQIPARDTTEKDAVSYFKEKGKRLSSSLWRIVHKGLREKCAEYGLTPLKGGRKRRV
jgi:hypothetical protein